MYRVLGLLMLGIFTAHCGAAEVIVFDFEAVEIPGSGNTNFQVEGPISFTQQGLTMTISHENGLGFAFNRRTGPQFQERFGSQAFSAFGSLNDETRFDPGAFILDFDSAVDSISVDMGDFGVEEDNLLIEAFDGAAATGNKIGSATGFVPLQNNFHFDNVALAASGIRSVRMIGGSEDIPNSVFYDNITVEVTAIPEPNTAFVLLVGSAVVCRRHQRRARKSPRLA